MLLRRALPPRSMIKRFSTQKPIDEKPKEVKSAEEKPVEAETAKPVEAETAKSVEAKTAKSVEAETVKSIGERARDSQSKGANNWNIPNALSLARIAASPVLCSLVIYGHYKSSLSLFALIAMSDMLDGFIARRFNQQTPLGSHLDPIADKVLVTGLTLALCKASLLPTPLAALIIGRDAVLVIASLWLRWNLMPQPKTFDRFVALRMAEVKPSTLSKINTALQLMLLGATMAMPVIGLEWIVEWLRYSVAATTVSSGILYFIQRNAFKIL